MKQPNPLVTMGLAVFGGAIGAIVGIYSGSKGIGIIVAVACYLGIMLLIRRKSSPS